MHYYKNVLIIKTQVSMTKQCHKDRNLMHWEDD